MSRISMSDIREALARLVRTLDAKSAEDQERLGRYWDNGLADGAVQEDVYRRADAILASFDVTPRGEGGQPGECTARHPGTRLQCILKSGHRDVHTFAIAALTPTQATAYRVARWRHTRWIEPHPAYPTDVYLRPEGGAGAHALYAGCRDCDEVLLPETFESIPPPSAEDAAPTGHDHEWQRRQNVTSRGYRMTPYEVCVVDGCGAARQVDEPATPRGEDQWWESLVEAACDKGHRIFIDDGDGGVYACPACALPPTVKPSVEDVARAILMATQAADVDPDYAWSVQYPEVQDELLDQARAVLALFEKGDAR